MKGSGLIVLMIFALNVMSCSNKAQPLPAPSQNEPVFDPGPPLQLSQSDPKSGPIDECVDGPTKNAVEVHKVFYGTSLPTHVTLSKGQRWSIGWFGGCSGTMISDRWVLSARHCNGHWNGGHS